MIAEDQTYLMTMLCCVSVQCHPGVCWLNELPGCRVSVMSVRACLKVLTDSREQCCCLRFPDFLRFTLLWLKVICFPEERLVPSFLPPTHTPQTPTPPPPCPDQPPHLGDPSNYTNCSDLKVKEDSTSPCCALRLWISLQSLRVCECVFSRKHKMWIIHC